IIALRVDEISHFDCSNQNTPPPLVLSELLPWTANGKVKLDRQTFENNITVTPTPRHETITMLLVRSGAITLALATQNIDHIQELFSVQTPNIDADTLIEIKNELLPVHSLSRLCTDNETCPEAIAVIVNSEQGSWALLVQQVLGFQQISHAYVSNANHERLCLTAKQLHEWLEQQNHQACFWYISPTGAVQQLLNANLLINRSYKPLKVSIINAPQLDLISIKSTYASFENEGLQIDCGTNHYLLPLALVKRTLNDLPLSTRSRRRFLTTANRAKPHTRLPLINACALLSTQLCLSKTRCILLLSLPNQAQALLSVNQALLCLPTDTWQGLHLPQPASLLFDAASYDATQQRWVLRLNSTFDFCFLPFSLKKAIVKSISGWFDADIIDNYYE
ncbi:MAG: chemotaxis protein CheW, partial [Methylococcaceae bacterium]